MAKCGASSFGSDWSRLSSLRTLEHQRRAVLEQKKFEDQYYANRQRQYQAVGHGAPDSVFDDTYKWLSCPA